MFPPYDERYMHLALNLARRGVGMTAPNPSVGCVVVQNDTIIGRGNTAPGGRPHAETLALTQAGSLAKGATAYVTLEPCGHYGKTSPCADALIKAGIAHAVIATKDSNPQVSGKGIAMLEAAGIQVTLGIGEAEARRINAGFFSVHERGRPLITLKLATSLDGNIAMAGGESKWITGEAARQYAHLLRAQHDAVMVGINTVHKDNPELTCRLPGLTPHSPVRIVIDSQLSISPSAKLVVTANHHPTFIITAKENAVLPPPVKVHRVATKEGQVDMHAALEWLAQQGITRILVEGGAKLAASLLKAKLVDRLVWFHAPKIMGGDAISGVGELGKALLQDIPQCKRESVRECGEDIVETYRVL